MKKRTGIMLVALAGLAAWTSAAMGQAPMGTAFTYQGQLKQGGLPVTNTADFQFTLWDALTGGNPIGSMIPVNGKSVVNGLFTVTLDFGVAPFNGEARWLEIAVRSPAGSADFTTLSPRQELTPTPYALQTRGIFVDEAGKVGIGTTTPLEMLHVVGPDGTGGVLIPWSGWTTFGYNEGGLVYYNVNVCPGETLVRGLHVDVGSAIFDDNVGIGTSSPAYDLDVAGDIRATGTIYGTVDNADKVDNYHAGNSSGQVAVSNGTVCTNLNADKVDGLHLADLDSRYVNEGQASSVSTGMLQDDAVTAAKLAHNINASGIGFNAAQVNGATIQMGTWSESSTAVFLSLHGGDVQVSGTGTWGNHKLRFKNNLGYEIRVSLIASSDASSSISTVDGGSTVDIPYPPWQPVQLIVGELGMTSEWTCVVWMSENDGQGSYLAINHDN